MISFVLEAVDVGGGPVDFGELQFVVPGQVVHEAHDGDSLRLSQAFIVRLFHSRVANVFPNIFY